VPKNRLTRKFDRNQDSVSNTLTTNTSTSSGVSSTDLSAPAEQTPTEIPRANLNPSPARHGTFSYRIRLPLDIASEYSWQYEDSEFTDEDELLEDRLVKCVHHTAERPLYFNDTERAELESLLGVNLFSARELIDRLSRTNSLTVGGVAVPLTQQVIDRLRMRCEAYNVSYAKFVTDAAVAGIEREIGLR
jgi:hypothetical protein